MSFPATLRHVVAVLAGYLVFAMLAAALFGLSHRDPHQAQDWIFTAFSILYGAIAGTVAGYLAAWIGRSNPMSHARTLAVAIAAVAIVSLLARPGAPWTELATIFLFAPCTLLGGWLRATARR